MEEEKIVTDIFRLYETGKNFNRLHALYEDGKDNYDYYHGRQWEGLEKPNQKSKAYTEPVVLNIIAPIVKLKVGAVNRYDYQIVFAPNTYQTSEELKQLSTVTKGLTQFVNKMWEKSQSGKKVRQIVKNACINSEGVIHFYNEGEEIKSEEIDKNNIYYGNENESDIQKQPYILSVFRMTVKEARQRARRYREAGMNNLTDEQINGIVSDMDFFEQQGKEYMLMEVSPMCLVVQKYERGEDGKVYVSESTQTCDLLEPQSTGCELYPFAHYLWEEEKGYARGISAVKNLIPNQREINKTATRRALAVKIGAFPKLVYDGEYVKNPDALNKVGSAIELQGMRADDVNKVVSYLRPANMSTDAYNLQQDLIQGTRELAGASDAVTGSIDPTQASGKAILAVQEASREPLQEHVQNYRYFLEDCANILFEMIKVYYVDGLTLYASEETVNELGQTESFETPFTITQEELESLNANLKVETTRTSAFDKLAQESGLVELLTAGMINFEEFVQALADDSSYNKPELESIVKKRKEARNQITAMQQEINAMNGAIQEIAIEDGGGFDEMSQMPISGNASGESGEQNSSLQM